MNYWDLHSNKRSGSKVQLCWSPTSTERLGDAFLFLLSIFFFMGECKLEVYLNKL